MSIFYVLAIVLYCVSVTASAPNPSQTSSVTTTPSPGEVSDDLGFVISLEPVKPPRIITPSPKLSVINAPLLCSEGQRVVKGVCRDAF